MEENEAPEVVEKPVVVKVPRGYAEPVLEEDAVEDDDA